MEYFLKETNKCLSQDLIQQIFDGKILISSSDSLDPIKNKALSILTNNFGADLNASFSLDDISNFVQKASLSKTEFTANSDFEEQLRLFVDSQLCMDPTDFLYDKPRLRIIPNSTRISSGVSYNYKLHRDTWYGAGIDQLNVWFPILNVSKDRTFGIAPDFFAKSVPNTSQSFDLDTWDQVHRPLASSNSNILSENRPHPMMKDSLPNPALVKPIDLDNGQYVLFSGHHLHGSIPNLTPLTRISCDFRLYLKSIDKLKDFRLPKNSDSASTGDYRKYLSPL